MRGRHLPVAEAAGAETKLEEPVGLVVEVGADLKVVGDVAGAAEEDDASVSAGAEPESPEPELVNAALGPGYDQPFDLKLSAQMSGNLTPL